MTPTDMKLWRVRCAVSQDEAGQALGVTAQTVWNYENGKRPIPRLFALACYGSEVRLFNGDATRPAFDLNPPEGDDDATP